MLKIRSEQEAELREYALGEYVERTLAQFHQYFPGPCHVIGDDPLRGMIRLGVERAAKHQILGECNVVLYTSVMLLCGSFFDEDPQYPWARQVLGDKSITTEGERADRLYDACADYWDRVAGGDRSSLIRSAMRMRKQPVEQFDSASPQEIAERLRRAWPNKATELGDRGMHAVLREGQRRAAEYQMTSRRDRAVTSSLIFTLGSGFDKDPMHPWAADVLTRPDIPSADRGARLYEASQQYAERWVEFARQEAE